MTLEFQHRRRQHHHPQVQLPVVNEWRQRIPTAWPQQHLTQRKLMLPVILVILHQQVGVRRSNKRLLYHHLKRNRKLHQRWKLSPKPKPQNLVHRIFTQRLRQSQKQQWKWKQVLSRNPNPRESEDLTFDELRTSPFSLVCASIKRKATDETSRYKGVCFWSVNCYDYSDEHVVLCSQGSWTRQRQW